MEFNKEHVEDTLMAFCSKNNIKDDNFIACTLKVPRKTSYDAQKEELIDIVHSFDMAIAGCIEWSDKRAEGWHFHGILHSSELTKLKSLGVYIVDGFDLEGWIAYIIKFRAGKVYLQVDENVVPGLTCKPVSKICLKVCPDKSPIKCEFFHQMYFAIFIIQDWTLPLARPSPKL